MATRHDLIIAVARSFPPSGTVRLRLLNHLPAVGGRVARWTIWNVHIWDNKVISVCALVTTKAIASFF